MSKPPEECQFHNNCGGWCETEEEKDYNLCEHCLEADREREEQSRMDSERRNALQRIAVAAGIELATPNEVADIVCAKLLLANVPDHLLPLAFGTKACSAGDVHKSAEGMGVRCIGLFGIFCFQYLSSNKMQSDTRRQMEQLRLFRQMESG